MKSTLTRLRFPFALVLSLSGMIPVGGGVALAQSVEPPTVQEPTNQSNEVNSSNPFGNGLNLNNIIHNANLSRSRGGGEFADDSRRQMKKAADEFKQLQLQRIQQQQAAPVAPTEVTGN